MRAALGEFTQGEYYLAQMGRQIALGRVSSPVRMRQLGVYLRYDPNRGCLVSQSLQVLVPGRLQVTRR